MNKRLWALIVAIIPALAFTLSASASVNKPSIVTARTSSSISQPGTYHQIDRKTGRHVTITVTEGPIHAFPQAKTASASTPNCGYGCSYWCRNVGWNVSEDGELSDFLVTGLCWNHYTASAYGAHAACSLYVINGQQPGTCGYQQTGYICNWCQNAGAWGNYWQSCVFGTLQCNIGISLMGNQWGAWWGNWWPI